MRMWVSKHSEVPVREQLATQILLGILSQELQGGQKLPSTRELARRLDIHPNTVSATYRDLTRRGWVEFRKGSGVYVRTTRAHARRDAGFELEQLIAGFFQSAREQGYPLGAIQARLRHWLEIQPPDHFLVIEPDAELRKILVAEMQETTTFPVLGASPSDCRDADRMLGAAAVFLSNKAEEIRSQLPPVGVSIQVHPRSALAALQRKIPIRPEALIAVASGWPAFLRWARAILIAAGTDAEALNLCDTRKPGWQRGLRGATAVITDVITARRLPKGCRVHIFRLISDSSLAELRRFKDSVTFRRYKTS
jgi:DNA-binding transcriptional regulator YhcF (GntR family)